VVLAKWLRVAERSRAGVPFAGFQSVIAKLWHTFISIPNGKGLISPYNAVMWKSLLVIYIN